MKHLLLIFSILVASASAGTRFDDELREFFEYIKQQMPCGFSGLGIPPLAPYTNDFKEFNLTNLGVDLSGRLTNLRVDGLNDFEITELTYATLLMRLHFDFNFNQIKLFSQYFAKGGLKLLGLPVPLVGNGDLDLVVENVRFNGSFRLMPTQSNGLQMWAFNCNLDMEKVQSKTTGIMNSPIFSKIFNQWVEEFFRILFQDYQKEINGAIEHFILSHANDCLKDITMAELFGLVLGLGPNTGDLPVCEL